MLETQTAPAVLVEVTPVRPAPLLGYLDVIATEGCRRQGCIMPNDIDTGLIRYILEDEFEVVVLPFSVPDQTVKVKLTLWADYEGHDESPEDTARRLARRLVNEYNATAIRLPSGAMFSPGRNAA